MHKGPVRGPFWFVTGKLTVRYDGHTPRVMKKIVLWHLGGTLLVYFVFALFFSILFSFSLKDGDTGGEAVGHHITRLGSFEIERIEYRGAGSGEFGGCSRNFYLGEKERFLFGIDGCYWSPRGYTSEFSRIILFLLGLASPILIVISFVFFLASMAIRETGSKGVLFFHLALLPVDFILFIILACTLGTPSFIFSEPFRGRYLG